MLLTHIGINTQTTGEYIRDYLRLYGSKLNTIKELFDNYYKNKNKERIKLETEELAKKDAEELVKNEYKNIKEEK